MPDVEVALVNTAGLSSVVAFWVFVVAAAFRKWRLDMINWAMACLLLGFVSLTACIAVRAAEAGRFPIANLYESLLLFAWAIIGVYLWLSRTYDIRHLGWLVSLCATVFFLYGSWLPADQHAIKPLMPALVSYWRQIHVPPLIVSYALFTISGICSFAHFWHAGKRKTLYATVSGLLAGIVAIGLGTFTTVDVRFLQALFVGGGILGLAIGWLWLSQPTHSANAEHAQLDDDIAQRCISVGVPLLTIGIITGALWANHAWGTYWSWDPKESMSLVTWLSYSGYIHLRANPKFSADKLALVAVAGMQLTLMTYLGFNALGFGGLHSYGSFK